MGNIGLVLHDRYKLVAEIGKGGMSTVFLAKDLKLDSYWAVKEVRNTSSVEFVAFKMEVELLSSLANPDIPRIVDRIEFDGHYYVVMDFVDGTSLSKIIDLEGAQKEQDVVEWGKQLCDILKYLHTTRDNPIVYRDMKPSNVMLTQSGRIKLIDFGIAKECPRGQKIKGEALGTRGYAAPEQYAGGSNIVDERSDIYSLGATLFYLATGVNPQRPPKGVPRLRSIAPYASEGLDFVIAKCTADNPSDRYQSISDVRADLNNIEKLTSSYRKTMKSRLVAFVACLVLSGIFAITGILGNTWMQADFETIFQSTYLQAREYEKNEEFQDAATYYALAIDAKPELRETYILYFNALLPKENEENHSAVLRNAIDEMCRRYLDNEQSLMSDDAQLMYMVVTRCVETNDTAYAGKALGYIDRIRKISGYANLVPVEQLNRYEIIARFLSQDVSLDFNAFSEALLELEDYVQTTENLSTGDKLANYYLLIQMYSSYPSEFEKPYEKIYQFGGEVQTVLEEAKNVDDIQFNNVIRLCRMVAVSQYNGADYYSDIADKRKSYDQSIEWFEYLDDMGVNFDEAILYEKASAYKAVFDLYNTPENRAGGGTEATEYLNKAIEIYEEMASNYPDSFLANVSLAQAYTDKEFLKPDNQRNYSLVLQFYNKAKSIKEKSENISWTHILRFQTLAKQLQNAGVEV